MALLHRINRKATADENTGFGTNSSMYGGRFVNRNGRANVHKTGLSIFDRYSWYHTLIEMPVHKFLALIFISFLLANLLFAIVYFLIGVENLGGMVARNKTEEFIEAYFFSAQTFTTVGYGRINPTGYFTSFVASFEAFTGLLFFALATGLFYARFSRPEAFIKFSENALMAPYKDGIALMFRMVPYKNTHLTDSKVKVTMAATEEENGKQVNRFYTLNLELSQINALNLSWTLVHPVDEKSPLYNLSKEDIIKNHTEILVFVNAFDETFSNTVVARTSYTGEEMIFGEKFVPMYQRAPNGKTTILELDKLNATQPADISFAFKSLEAENNQKIIPKT